MTVAQQIIYDFLSFNVPPTKLPLLGAFGDLHSIFMAVNVIFFTCFFMLPNTEEYSNMRIGCMFWATVSGFMWSIESNFSKLFVISNNELFSEIIITCLSFMITVLLISLLICLYITIITWIVKTKWIKFYQVAIFTSILAFMIELRMIQLDYASGSLLLIGLISMAYRFFDDLNTLSS